MPIRTRGPGGSILPIGLALLVVYSIVNSYNPEYRFDGTIRGERVIFSEDVSGGNYLTVTRKDGQIVKYGDVDNDFSVDSVTIKIGESLFTYSAHSPDPEERELFQRHFAEFQREFDSYLETIIEGNKAP